MKNVHAMENNPLDATIGLLAGLVGGVTKYLIDVPIVPGSFFIALAEAGLTALLCGFLGVAGKHLFGIVIKKIFSRKKQHK
jgi:hypothetical protein